MKKIAIKAAKEAGKILMDNFGKIDKITKKGRNNFVTNVDIAAEKKIISVIKSKYPKHGFLCEESGKSGKSDYVWVIDPVDGTHNYMQGLPLFGVSIGLRYKGETVLGVINLPLVKQIYVAEKGKGSFCNGSRISVAQKTRLMDVFLLYDSNIHKVKDKKFKLLKKLGGKVFAGRMSGCAVWNAIWIANGSADGFIAYNTYPWDVEAGYLLIKEAGGKIETVIKDRTRIEIAGNSKIVNVLKKLTIKTLS